MFRLLFEASEAYRNPTGIGRFTRALVEELPKYSDQLEVFFSPSDYAQRQHIHTQRTLFSRITHFTEHVALTQWGVSKQTRQCKPDVVFSPSFFSSLLIRDTPTVVTFHDLNYHEQPHLTDRFWGTYARNMMPIFAKRASAVITVTETVKQKVCDHFSLSPSKVHAITMGIDPKFQIINSGDALEEVRQKYDLYEPFALYVGAWYGTKNLPVLLQAFSKLQGGVLVLTGYATTPEQAQINVLAQKLKINTRFVGTIPDNELIALYNLAHVVVQPSLYEGFGMPVVEAMACGSPVIISDIDVLKEVAGDAAQVFPRHDVDALRRLLETALKPHKRDPQQSHKALQRASHYKWHKTIEQLISIWMRAAEQS